MADIQLNLINQAGDVNNSDYVIFQKNAATDVNVQSVAWIVVKNLGHSDNHPFIYPMEFFVSSKDSDGNYMPQIAAQNGDTYEVAMARSGHVLRNFPTPAANPTEVEVWNNLSLGAVDAQIYRDGKLLATKINVAPGSKANFQFLPKIFIGTVSQVNQGTVMNSNVTVQYLTELDLLGVSSADIIVSGGGAGPNATAFKFTLANVT
ncbi:MAG: hypothetical protein K0U40_08980 [Betaproteobacteria bacterium]|nr:hypothetical protein [Betaproteobacteria bacterium]